MRKIITALITSRSGFPALIIAGAVAVLIVTANSCKKEETPVIPVVETSSVTGITQTSASGGGKIIDNGGLPVLSRGVCWSFSDKPTILDRKTSDGKGDGVFTSSLTDLSPQAQYYVRAYATNSLGTGYGEAVLFSTSPVALCEVTTAEITDITSNSAKSGGTVVSAGGGSVIARGVCWGTSTGPVITDNKTSDYSGTGSFTSSITGLQPNQTYYARAYATNMAGVAYGNERSFKTRSEPPVVITGEVTNRSYTSATAGGEVISDGGSTVTERGVCYATHADPVISENKTPSGSGSGAFTVNLTGLDPGTLYYVRAYAVNASDTSYGASVSFSTLALALPDVRIVEISSYTSTSVTVKAEVVSDGGDAVTERGICWATSVNPSISDQYVSSGNGTGSFTVTIEGLTENTQYHLRAYGINNVGTAYSLDVPFTTAATSVTDGDGNKYSVIQIGKQSWLGENLKTTKFNDGTPIPLVTGNTEWSALTAPGYCWYNNDKAAYGDVYGALYNWYTVSMATNGNKNVCPVGWHVPTDAEWTVLTDYLGGASVAGGPLKETGTVHWLSPNTGATNTSGFTALPGGFRGTSYSYVRQRGYWWTGTARSTTNSWYRNMTYNQASVARSNTYKYFGLSVRCIKD
jgi:uncharacterized protein (TIGR02145 family)